MDKFIIRENFRRFCYFIGTMILFFVGWKSMLFILGHYYVTFNVSIFALIFVVLFLLVVSAIISKKVTDVIYKKLF